MLKEKIRSIAEEIHPEIIRYRRHLHANPELSFHEYETSAFVKSKLDELGIPWRSMANTGVVGMIKGEQSSDLVIALRADMDALPITEENDTDYASGNIGVMHACGHDAHTSSLLGTAAILQRIRAEFGGTIKLIFQPGEEKLPGGASLMISEHVLENPRPVAILGQHVIPSLEVGKVGIRKGKMMASMDEIFVTVYGRGGHGAQPHMNIDPVVIAAHIIVSLQQIVSRMAKPFLPTVLSFGKVIADGAINVIPDKVYMEGTFRTLDEEWRADAHERMIKMAKGIAESMGGRCEFTIVKGYPFLVNNEKLTGRVKELSGEYLGDENITEPEIWMAAEDFASYSQKTDACFYQLGVGNKIKGIGSSLHTSTFNIDEDALRISCGLMAWLAVRLLSEEAMGNGQ